MSKTKRNIVAVAGIAALALGGAGVAAASNGSGLSGSESPTEEIVHAPDSSGSRLDDGADLLSQAKISEQEAITAAQTAASGPLNEVDLESYEGRLVFNVDVGSNDVKVDSATGKVLAAPVDE